MKLKQLFLAVPVSLLFLGNCAAKAGQTINEEGAFACVTDKWDEKEQTKGHKLVDFASRCVLIPVGPTRSGTMKKPKPRSPKKILSLPV